MLKNKNTAIILLLLLAVLALGVLPVFANQIGEKENELQNIQGEINEERSDLKERKAEKTTIQRELQELDDAIRRARNELNSVNSKIMDKEAQIVKSEAKLQEAEERIEEQDALLALRLRSIYENGQVSYLEVLFESSDFTDFLTRFNDLQTIISSDKELLEAFEKEREKIKAIKDELEQQRQQLLPLREKSLAQKKELEKKEADRSTFLAKVQKEINAQEKAIREMEAAAKEIETIIKQMQAKQQAEGLGYRGSGQLIWPVPEFGPAWITSPYGWRRHPITGLNSFHGGIDIGIPHNRWPASRYYIGTPANVVAADSGIAYTAGGHWSYGRWVFIDHGNGVSTVYAHNHSVLVANGQSVHKGQVIAHVGSTGSSTGPHLHFEVRINGERVNPSPYVR